MLAAIFVVCCFAGACGLLCYLCYNTYYLWRTPEIWEVDSEASADGEEANAIEVGAEPDPTVD